MGQRTCPNVSVGRSEFEVVGLVNEKNCFRIDLTARLNKRKQIFWDVVDTCLVLPFPVFAFVPSVDYEDMTTKSVLPDLVSKLWR